MHAQQDMLQIQSQLNQIGVIGTKKGVYITLVQLNIKTQHRG